MNRYLWGPDRTEKKGHCFEKWLGTEEQWLALTPHL